MTRPQQRLTNRAASFALTGVALILAACAGPASDDQAAVVDSGAELVVAEVNGVPIYARQLAEVVEAEQMRRQAREEPLNEADAQELRRQALRLAIGGELVVQAARAAGMQVTGEEIDEYLETASSQFESEEAFETFLHEAGSSQDELRREAERELLMRAYADSVVEGQALDEERAREIYLEQKERFREEEQIRAAHIIVRTLPTDPPEEREAARRKIDEAYQRLQNGEAFGEVARRYSESPFAERDGDLGFFPRGRALPEFEEVVFNTPVGQVTPIFETPHGFNVVQVLDRREGATRSFEEVRAGLMMVLARERHDEQLRQRVEELRAAADIRILDPQLQ